MLGTHAWDSTNWKDQSMTEPNHKILVVGATGTVGSALVEALAAAGEKVKAATRDPSRAFGKGVEAVLYDFDDPQTFDAALDGVDRVFYLSRPADVQAADVAAPLFEKAAASGVNRIVNMSAMGVDADDNIPLRQVEILLEKSTITHTLLRPNWFMQNFSVGSFNGMIREQNGLFLPAADASVSFIDARDIAAVAAKVLTEDGHASKSYALTGAETFTHSEVAQELSKVVEKTITYTAISDGDMKSGLEAQAMPDTVIDFMLALFGAMRAGYNASVTGDVSKVLGQQPRTLSAFAREFAASF